MQIGDVSRNRESQIKPESNEIKKVGISNIFTDFKQQISKYEMRGSLDSNFEYLSPDQKKEFPPEMEPKRLLQDSETKFKTRKEIKEERQKRSFQQQHSSQDSRDTIVFEQLVNARLSALPNDANTKESK